MKNLVTVLVMLIGVSSLVSFKSIKENTFKTGNIISISDYCDGWKDVKGEFAICPITPICPIPEIGKDDFRGGYNRAFKAGMKAARQ